MSDTPAPTILIVEDEVLIRDLMEAALEDGGFNVMFAENGIAAIERLDELANELAAVVTDIDLGRGPEGWEIAHRARRLNTELQRRQRLRLERRRRAEQHNVEQALRARAAHRGDSLVDQHGRRSRLLIARGRTGAYVRPARGHPPQSCLRRFQSPGRVSGRGSLLHRLTGPLCA